MLISEMRPPTQGATVTTVLLSIIGTISLFLLLPSEMPAA